MQMKDKETDTSKPKCLDFNVLCVQWITLVYSLNHSINTKRELYSMSRYISNNLTTPKLPSPIAVWSKVRRTGRSNLSSPGLLALRSHKISLRSHKGLLLWDHIRDHISGEQGACDPTFVSVRKLAMNWLPPPLNCSCSWAGPPVSCSTPWLLLGHHWLPDICHLKPHSAMLLWQRQT